MLTEWDKLVKFLKELIANKFYGTFEIKFEGGKIMTIRKIESIKL